MGLIINAACGSEIGYIRSNNEDNCYFNGYYLEENNKGISPPWFQCFQSGTMCFGVFDGMGGIDDGQTASYLAVKSFASDCRVIGENGLLSESFFSGAISHMNTAVNYEANHRKTKMGTTAVLAGFCDDKMYVCNVGDSRIYRFRNGVLTQLSIDHIEAIPPFLKEKKHIKARLNQCIGLPQDEIILEPYIATGVIQANDIYLLCSDGLTDMLSNLQIRQIIAEIKDVGVAVNCLIKAALEAGGRDNITVVVLQVVDL